MIPNIVMDNNNHFAVCGELSFSTVTELQKHAYELINTAADPTFDLRQTIVKDISALALLICLTRFSHNNEKQIRFVNLPEQLLGMLKLHNLTNILSSQ